MATNQTPAKNAEAKPVKAKKAPVATSVRITDQMKRGALGGKLTGEELDKLAALATALKTFVEA